MFTMGLPNYGYQSVFGSFFVSLRFNATSPTASDPSPGFTHRISRSPALLTYRLPMVEPDA